MLKELDEIEFGNYFIPFSAHISTKTVISKSGLISQTVFIASSQDINISHNIISALQKILTPNVFVNIHAINTENTNTKPESFIHYLLKSYNRTVATHNQYTQGFYITISIYGHKIDMKNFGHFLLKKRFLMDIEHENEKLEAITKTFCKEILQYKPHILQIQSTKDILFSENSKFLYNVFYGRQGNIPLADEEISSQIKPPIIKHGINYLHFTRGKVTDFVSILTIKEFPIAEKRKMAELFTIDSQYIIAQSFYQMNNTQITPLFIYQSRSANVLRDNPITHKTGWAQMLKTQQPICMQTNVIIHGKTKEEMEISVQKIITKLQEIGLSVFREDINCEQTFYASLPANPHFINRKEYTTLNYTSQFVTTPNFLFRGMEYIKNINFLPIVDNEKKLFGISPFLSEGTKHILLNGSNIKGKNLLINTMLLHLYNSSRILCIDEKYSSFALIKTIGGTCISQPSFNFFTLLQFSQKSFFILFSSAVKFFCTTNNIQYTQELSKGIEEFVKQAKQDLTIEDALQISQNETIQKTIKFLQAQNLLSEKDSIISRKSYCAINLNFEDEHCQIICLYIMLALIHTGNEGDILKLDHTFDTFTENIIAQQTLSFVLKEANAKGISFIMGNDLSQNFEQQNAPKYNNVLATFEFQIFLESNCSTQFVKKFFQVKSNVAKHLMFIKSGSNKAVINTSTHIFTTKLTTLTENKRFEIFDNTHPKYIENIKILNDYKDKQDELLELFLQQNA